MQFKKRVPTITWRKMFVARILRDRLSGTKLAEVVELLTNIDGCNTEP